MIIIPLRSALAFANLSLLQNGSNVKIRQKQLYDIINDIACSDKWVMCARCRV